MIKIIKGVYGYRNNGAVEAKTAKSAPFKCSSLEEARLVKAGVAEYVKESEAVVTPAENAKATEKRIEDMSYQELQAQAKAMGLTVEGNKKADYIEAIKNAVKGGEEAPSFDAGSTVVG